MRAFCLLVLVAVQARISESQSGGSSNFAASLLTGLFDTITATADSKGCPGKCVHAIASLICDDVIEDAPCPYASLRCCIEKKPPPIYHQEGQGSGEKHEVSTRQPVSVEEDEDDEDDEDDDLDDGYYRPHIVTAAPSSTRPIPTTHKPTTTTTTTTTTTRPTTTTTTPRPKPVSTTKKPVPNPAIRTPVVDEDSSTGDVASTEEPDTSHEGSTEEDVKDSSSRQEVSCPGVCVATRIARFCEEVVDGTDDLCPDNLHCCVSKEGEDGTSAEDVSSPTAVHILTRSNISAAGDQVLDGDDEDGTTQIPIFIPEELRCQGTCVSPLFSFLCDDVDLEAVCPQRGRCCITRRVSTPPPPPPPCPGVCVSAQRADLCPQPSTILRYTSNCLQGTLCCASGLPHRLPPPPPHGHMPHGPNQTHGDIFIPPPYPHPPRPLPHRPPPYFHRPGYYPPPHFPPHRPNPNFKPHPSPSPATTEAPQQEGKKPPLRQEVDDRPACPGSCIFNYLSFTCFRNAEMTSLFRCGKSGTRCCAPKSVIRDLEEQNNLARNDSSSPTNGVEAAEPSGNFSGGRDPETSDNSASIVTTTTSPRPQSFNRYICGVKGNRRTARVVGGEDAEPGEWCWQVALINSLNQYLCGGALIGTQWVLTAAHCVTNTVRSGDAIYVRVGDHDLTSKYGSPGAQTLRVATTYIHHNHNSQTLDNDIALLKLHGQVELKEGVCLVCLPARGVSQVAGKRCIVTGYGYMGETAGPIPLHVREAEVPTVSDSECIRKINAVTEKIFILPASSFCAGGEEGNDACQGDGGGPLVCQDDGYYELTGLVSWGFGCGRADVPGVYVKVSSFIGWINQIISVNNL